MCTLVPLSASVALYEQTVVSSARTGTTEGFRALNCTCFGTLQSSAGASVVPVSLAGTYRHYWEPPLYAVCIKDGSTCVLTTDVTCLEDINAEGVLKLQAGFRPYYARNIYANEKPSLDCL